MHDIKEEALVELYSRIKFYRTEFALKTCKRNPDRPVNDYAYPALFIIEGKDSIIEHSSRSGLGYPAKRSCNVLIELVVDSTVTNIKSLFYNVRKAVFTKQIADPSSPTRLTPILAFDPESGVDASIREVDFDGPFSLQIPNVLGMSVNFELIYIDNGLGG